MGSFYQLARRIASVGYPKKVILSQKDFADLWAATPPYQRVVPSGGSGKVNVSVHGYMTEFSCAGFKKEEERPEVVDFSEVVEVTILDDPTVNVGSQERVAL